MPPIPAYTLRPPRGADLDAVLRVQAACYPPPMQEPAAVVAARIEQAGASSLLAVHQDGAIGAYAFAYRSRLGAVTPLDAHFAPDPRGDALYLHDLAVAPAGAGLGLARRLATQLLMAARDAGLTWCALVSVQDSQAYWERLGFRAADCGDAAARAALATYPAPALYMARRVAL